MRQWVTIMVGTSHSSTRISFDTVSLQCIPASCICGSIPWISHDLRQETFGKFHRHCAIQQSSRMVSFPGYLIQTLLKAFPFGMLWREGDRLSFRRAVVLLIISARLFGPYTVSTFKDSDLTVGGGFFRSPFSGWTEVRWYVLYILL